MDKQALIASLDILSQNFADTDIIGQDLRAMSIALGNLSDEDFSARMAKKTYPTFKCPTCGSKVLEQTKYCLKCKEKVEDKKASETTEDFWSSEAFDRVASALIAEVIGVEVTEEVTVEAAKEPTKEWTEVATKEEPKEGVSKEAAVEVTAVVTATEEVKEEPKKEETKESAVVNTDILAAVTFGDVSIEAPIGVVSSDDLGNLSAEEKDILTSLYNT